jgi:hypothetical protein
MKFFYLIGGSFGDSLATNERYVPVGYGSVLSDDPVLSVNDLSCRCIGWSGCGCCCGCVFSGVIFQK